MKESDRLEVFQDESGEYMVRGRPLPLWAVHLKGVLIPAEFANGRRDEDPEMLLAEYLNGKGKA